MPALVTFDSSPGSLEAMGFSVVARIDGAAALIGPPAAFERLAREPGFSSARLSRPVRLSLDSSLVTIHAPRIRHGNPPHYSGPTGRGVIIGIVDSGVDLFHHDFRRPDGSSRVLAFWDQYSANVDLEVPIGRVFRESDLAWFFTHPDILKFDEDGHGTHVAGIAAGDGSASGSGKAFQYVGVAPEADLVVVRSGLDEVAILAGVRFIFEEAARRGQPAVVNLSLGHQYGPHNGADPFERLISEQCGPGRLVTVAAGNEGGIDMHALIPEGAGAESVSVQIPPYPVGLDDFAAIQLEAWVPLSADLEYVLVLPDGTRFGPIRPGKSVSIQRPSFTLHLSEAKTNYGRFFSLEAILFGAPRIYGEWVIVVQPRTNAGRPATHFWIPYSDLGQGEPARFVRGLDHRSTLSSPANGMNVVSVAASVSKRCWTPRGANDQVCYQTPGNPGELAVFSSIGPTADGRLKPEVTAPGMGIVSALSSTMSPASRNAVNLTRVLDPDGVHWISAGTSMSSPHVAGALALLLERVPDLSPAAAQARLRGTGKPVTAPEGGFVGPMLDLNALAGPAALLSSFEITELPDRRAQVVWVSIPFDPEVVFRLSRGTAPAGPFDALTAADRTGRGPHQYVDGPLPPGRTYYYRLSADDIYGISDGLDTLAVAIDGEPSLTLSPPRGNPGPPPVRLSFFVPPRPGAVSYRLDVFDLQGRVVRGLASGEVEGALRDVVTEWDGTWGDGRRAAAGVYFVRLIAGGESRSARIVLRR
jgi:subtilisin family serine protease